MQRIKIFTGEDVIRRCVGRGKNRRCKPFGKAFKFPGYTYILVNENTPALTGASSS